MQQTIKLSCKNFRNPLFPTIQNVDNINKVGTFYKIVKSLVLFLVFSKSHPKIIFWGVITPKNGKAAFVTYKTSFVKGNGRFCNRCKQIGHIEQYCQEQEQTNQCTSSIKFDSCYMLTKGVNGVQAKFIGTPIVGSKKKAI
jgi:hypothetical protein